MSESTPVTPPVAARHAYQTLEPFHTLAYFNPAVRATGEALGLDAAAFYVGARAAVLGNASATVVEAAFYNFSPTTIANGWASATAVGLDAIDAARYSMLDEQLRGILGDTIDLIPDLLPEYEAVIAALPVSGRPLGGAWARSPIPTEPHLALWRHTTALREWRGDNHIAALVTHDLSGLEAGVFHEADLPEEGVVRRTLGRRFFQGSRGWSDDDWNGAVAHLAERGLVEPAGSADQNHRLTDSGYDLYRALETITDTVSGDAFDAGLEDLLVRTRPIVKAVIDAGVLPGTKKK